MTAASAPETTHPATSASAIDAFLRHRASFAASAGLVLFLTFLLTISITPLYKSECSILIRNPGPGAPGTQIDILRSREVAESIVDPAWPKTPPAHRSGAEILQHERAIATFTRHLEVRVAPGSNTLHVAFVAKSSREAADTLGRLIDAFAARRTVIEAVTPPVSIPVEAHDQERSDPAELQNRIASLDAGRLATQVQLDETTARIAAQKRDLAILSPWVLGDVNPAYKQGKEKLTASIAQLVAERGRIVALTSQREHLSHQLVGLRTAVAANPPTEIPAASAPPRAPVDEIVVTERPTLPTRPFRPQFLVNFIAGFCAALVFGLCAVVVAEFRRKRVSAPRQREEIATMPLSASIPLTAPRPQRIFGALALSPAFRHEEEPEPEVSAVLFAAQPNPAKFVPAPAARLVLEPLDPSHRVPSRGLGNAPIPPRSLLTPSQRAQLRRPPPVPGSDGCGYVTYTVEARQ